jgi:hypothetical protein
MVRIGPSPLSAYRRFGVSAGSELRLLTPEFRSPFIVTVTPIRRHASPSRRLLIPPT